MRSRNLAARSRATARAVLSPYRIGGAMMSILKSKFDIGFRVTPAAQAEHQYLYSGLIRLHILHHAVHEPPIFGLGMLEELARHGYKLSAGTLYPLLHGMEKKGYLRSVLKRQTGVERRIYTATPFGRKALKAAKERVRELFGELLEE